MAAEERQLPSRIGIPGFAVIASDLEGIVSISKKL